MSRPNFKLMQNSSVLSVILIIKRAASILERTDREKALLVIAIYAVLGLLDILAVLVFGLVGSLAVSGVSSNQPGERVGLVLRTLGIQDSSLQSQVSILGLLAASVLLFKSVASLYLSKRTLFFLSRRAAKISRRLIEKLLARDILVVRSRTIQETIFAVTTGVQSVTVSILGAALLLIADILLIVAFSASLFLVDTYVAILSLVLFSIVGILIYVVMHRKAKDLGEAATQLEIRSSDSISQVVSCYRELVVKDRRAYYSNQIGGMRLSIAEASANLTIMGLLSKYIMEITMVVGALVIGAVQFAAHPATRAVAVISIFLISSARIGPAVLRVQTGLVSIRANIGGAKPTLDLIEENLTHEVEIHERIKGFKELSSFQHEGFDGSLTVENIDFSYPGAEKSALQNFTVSLKAGDFLGIVGPSGAGKSTLVDLILGILNPTKGTIKISGKSPKEAISSWTGAIAYVPQEVTIISGTIKENVCLGFDSREVPDKIVEDLLEVVGLGEFNELPEGIDSATGERGSKISGGQRQRLGIARALFTSPRFLVLDEATSSLDALTELNLSSHLNSLRGKLTLIVVAHRLSTIKEADNLVYLKNGAIVGTGNFDELRKKVTEFDFQAEAMGL